MVSLRVKRTLGHTKIGLLWGFNLKLPTSIPAAPFIEIKGNSTSASRLPSVTRKTGKDRARSTSYKSKASESWYFIRK